MLYPLENNQNSQRMTYGGEMAKRANLVVKFQQIKLERDGHSHRLKSVVVLELE